MSGCNESSNNGFNAWTRRLRSSSSSHGSPNSGTELLHKGSEKVDLALVFDVSHGHSHVDGESNDSEISLNEELGIPSVVTPGAVDVQRSGGTVAYIHIGSAVIHQHVHEAITFGLPWKRKREKET